jgi:hypothetical protein
LAPGRALMLQNLQINKRHVSITSNIWDREPIQQSPCNIMRDKCQNESQTVRNQNFPLIIVSHNKVLTLQVLGKENNK